MKILVSRPDSGLLMQESLAFKVQVSFEKCAMKSQSKTIIDYEVTYDSTLIDRELLIATAFISMLTQWNKAKQQHSVATSRVSKRLRSRCSRLKRLLKPNEPWLLELWQLKPRLEWALTRLKCKGSTCQVYGWNCSSHCGKPYWRPNVYKGKIWSV